ncbi:MAG: flagellar hook-associated protein FlgK [Candidatus Berkiella sp.]
MSDLLGIASSGLQAIQKALNTTSHNISNVNTPGYSRQVETFVARPADKIGSGYIGTGVSALSTRRIVDQFTIDVLRTQTSNANELETLSNLLGELDGLLADPNTGVVQGFNNFFLSLQDLNNTPNSIPARQLFISQVNMLAGRFNDVYGQLQSQLAGTDQKIGFITTEINSLAQNIAGLNAQIGGNSASGQPNDLLDQRDQLLSELSKYVSVSSIQDTDGSINVFIGNGLPLVMGGVASTLGTQLNNIDPSKKDIVLTTPYSNQIITNNISGGQMGALLSMRDSVLTTTINAMGRLAITIASAMNDQHSLGIDLNGAQGGLIFSDVNSVDAIRNRSVASTSNTGNAILNVSINDINEPSKPPYEVFSSDTNIIDTSSLLSLQNGNMIVNGISIRAATMADDSVSSAGNMGSAIAIAAAINSRATQHGVTATAQPNVVYLGQFTAGAFAAGDFSINGVNIVTTGADEATLLQDINALSAQTGVRAIGDGNSNITLIAQDGRNIQLNSDVGTPVATFANFDTSSATALDKIQRASVALSSTQSMKITGNNLSSIGFSSGTTPIENSGLTLDNYSLSFDGTFYTLRRQFDDSVVVQSISSAIKVDGMTISIESGSMNIGDSFAILPTRNAALEIKAIIKDPKQLALAYPVATSASLNNTGTGIMKVSNVVDTSGMPVSTSSRLGNAFQTAKQLSPPIQIEFISDTVFRVYNVGNGFPGVQIGPDQIYDPASGTHEVFPISGVVDNALPGPNSTYVYDPGYRISLEGVPKTGDIFSIGFNQDGSGDNRNSIEMLGIQLDKLINGGHATLQDSLSQSVSDIASQASQASTNSEASKSFLDALETRRNNISGVNLEEEAANLLRFEQSYQAIAQLFSVARSLFDTLIGAFSR